MHHFITRMFRGAGDGDELQFGIPALLGILSTPAAFGAIMLMEKYSTLRLFLLRRPQFDVYRASIGDEYFFIVYSMVVTGAIVILKWDRLFPDRQDYDNLAVLPISARQIFISNLIALVFLTVVFAIDINWAACVIFPLAVTQKYDTFAAYSEFLIAHASAVMLASLFTCFALLCVLGMTMLVVPQRYQRRVSVAVRIACGLGLVAILGSAFTAPPLLLSSDPPEFLRFVPSVWFLDLHQALLDLGTPLVARSVFALQITVAVFLFAILLYALTYYRHFTRIPEQTGVSPSAGRDKHSLLRRAIDATLLRTPFQQATYHFILKTLFRSERHCLMFGLAAGIGFFLASGAVSDALAYPSRRPLDDRFLSVSLTLAYFIIISVRVLFDLPTDRNANWIFTSILDNRKHEARSVSTKVTLSLIVPWLLLVGLPLHVAAWGWKIALMHTGYVLLCSFTLAELLLMKFRKIPFTCAHTASKDRVLAMVIIALVGYGMFGPINAQVERRILLEPLRFAFQFPLFVVVLWWVRSSERELPARDRALIFEDRPDTGIQQLKLS